MMKSRTMPFILLLSFSLVQAGDIEDQMMNQGLIDIQSLDASIQIDLKYSGKDNFLGKDAYGELNRCYLQPEAAEKLVTAQKLLKEKRPDLTLLVYDGARPRSVQRSMWALVEGGKLEKYVANPDRGSIHNYGCAVDLTLATLDGTELDMGTPFDYFGDLSEPRHESRFLEQGILSEEQVANRELLREVMTAAGFHVLDIEWWHFNAYPGKVTREKFKIIE